jgi:hypothetical protein
MSVVFVVEVQNQSAFVFTWVFTFKTYLQFGVFVENSATFEKCHFVLQVVLFLDPGLCKSVFGENRSIHIEDTIILFIPLPPILLLIKMIILIANFPIDDLGSCFYFLLICLAPILRHLLLVTFQTQLI